MVIRANAVALQFSLLIAVQCLLGCSGTGRSPELREPGLGEFPQAAIAYLQHAMEWRDYAKALDTIVPADRPRYVRYFQLLEGEYQDWERLAGAIRKRFGWGTALEMAILDATALSPLRLQTASGVIDWSGLRFIQPGEVSDTTIANDLSGHYLVELVKVDGKWYVKDFNGGACAMEHMDTLARQISYFQKGIRDLIKVVENQQPAEIERRVYEALGRPGPKNAGRHGVKGSATRPTSARNPDPLLDS